MPIHLAPISRRRFLARSLMAGAGLALLPRVIAESKPQDDDFWALLSDTHLAADKSLVSRGVNMTDHFKQVAREIMDQSKRPAGVFITGDCAYNRGETGDYVVVKELLDALRMASMPIHLTLGNHDSRERFWDAFEAEKVAHRPVADRQASLLETGQTNWFLLDSLEKTASTPGLIGPEQLQWLTQALDAHPQKPAVVMVHHNPGIDGGNMGLKDTVPFLEIIRPRKQVKAFIFGHTHHWSVEKDGSGIHFINLPPVGYVFREGEPSGWVHATVGENSMRLELRCVDTTHKAHGQVFNLAWR